jgi:hypothetical protein
MMPKPFQSPYEVTNGSWWKGNLHTHTTQSDGIYSPEAICRLYADREYHWLCLSDHDQVTPIPEETHGLLVMKGCEITAGGPHILHVGAEDSIAPDSDRIKVLHQITDEPGFAILNHPNWEKTFTHWPQSLIEAMPPCYAGIEIYNGVTERQEGNPAATDRWDMLLSKGYRVWGYCNDDLHREADFARAWNQVHAESLTQDRLMEGLVSGTFYGSTGVQLSSLQTVGNIIRIVSTNGSLCVVIMDWGIELARIPGRAWELDLERLQTKQGASYLRFEIWGDAGTRAWTQPIYLECGERDTSRRMV